MDTKERIEETLNKHTIKIQEVFTILEKEGVGCLIVFELTDANKDKMQCFEAVAIHNINDFEKHKAIKCLISLMNEHNG